MVGVDVSFEIQANGQGLARDQALLVNGPVQFLNTSQAGKDFRWDFGDRVQPGETNPASLWVSNRWGQEVYYKEDY